MNTTRPPDWLMPAWPVADSGFGSLMSTRAGGVSRAPWDSLNLGIAVNDDPAAVAANRSVFAAALGGARPVFMKQVHGARVLRLVPAHAAPQAPLEEADACVTTEPGVACTVQVADCLPVLFAAPQGRAVGAAHAGWRGLSLGVLEATLRQVCEAADCGPQEVQAWLGVCIGPRRFEVGDDVREAFGAAHDAAAAACFNAGALPGKWLADLAGLARLRLQRAGVQRLAGAGGCTVEEASRFFSFRRDGVTGRMAAAIWIERAG